MDPADYVLRDFSSAELKDIAYLIDRCADAVEALVRVGIESAQNTFHAG